MKEIRIGNTIEQCVERSDYPADRIKQILKNEVVAVLGYGVQGRGQSLNMRDNGVKVIVGQRKGGKAYDLCLEDGWKPGETLFDPEEAAQARHRHPVPALRCRPEGDVAEDQAAPHEGQGALLLARLLDRLQRPDRASSPPKDIDVILVRPEGIGHHRPPALPRRPRHQLAASRSTRTPPAAPANAALPSASPSAPATCSRPPSRRKSSPT